MESFGVVRGPQLFLRGFAAADFGSDGCGHDGTLPPIWIEKPASRVHRCVLDCRHLDASMGQVWNDGRFNQELAEWLCSCLGLASVMVRPYRYGIKKWGLAMPLAPGVAGIQEFLAVVQPKGLSRDISASEGLCSFPLSTSARSSAATMLPPSPSVTEEAGSDMPLSAALSTLAPPLEP
eukprot:CAMPEP_0118997046 /NCGR_PEP_ID=MMETSP1173-20130426/61095_1 /TAXON_ID=1034831 /ORGANISM="Rhizochromulina marina cf, Strain CCMP1243" /LENGTH=178 /DNA_ID=CAMNT_0006948459 /DNA_START=475 /DNA_END=1012 /DNA_ORIENTATION=-